MEVFWGTTMLVNRRQCRQQTWVQRWISWPAATWLLSTTAPIAVLTYDRLTALFSFGSGNTLPSSAQPQYQPNGCMTRSKVSKEVKRTFVQHFIMCATLVSKALRLAHVNEGHTVSPATHTFIHKWNEPYLPLLPSHRASSHVGRYSFPIPLQVGGWVGSGGSVKHGGGLPARRWSPIPVLAALTGNRTRDHWLASATSNH